MIHFLIRISGFDRELRSRIPPSRIPQTKRFQHNLMNIMKQRPNKQIRPTVSVETAETSLAQYVSRALECQVRLSVSDALPESQCGKIYLRQLATM